MPLKADQSELREAARRVRAEQKRQKREERRRAKREPEWRQPRSPVSPPSPRRALKHGSGAVLWIMTNQFARRNLNASQRGYLIGKRFNAEAPGQGARTDLGAGQGGVAERLGREFNMTDRAVRDCGRFAEAVDVITDSIGVEARHGILGMEVPFSREEIRTIASLPEPERQEVWEAALKDRSSLKKVMAGEKRKETRKDRADAVKLPGDSKAKAMERYDLADLVRLIATVWPEDRVRDYMPSYPQQIALETNAEGALRTLIRLAELRGWGEAALEDYLAEQDRAGAESADEDAPEGGRPAPEPAAALEAPAAEPEADPMTDPALTNSEDLRELVKAASSPSFYRSMTEVAGAFNLRPLALCKKIDGAKLTRQQRKKLAGIVGQLHRILEQRVAEPAAAAGGR